VAFMKANAFVIKNISKYIYIHVYTHMCTNT
jgi:hypothetical protein